MPTFPAAGSYKPSVGKGVILAVHPASPARGSIKRENLPNQRLRQGAYHEIQTDLLSIGREGFNQAKIMTRKEHLRIIPGMISRACLKNFKTQRS